MEAAFVEGTLEELRRTVPKSAQESLLPPSEGEKPIVLVVEDNPDMNRFIVESLSKDYQLITAFDGQEGWRRRSNFVPRSL